MTGLIEPQLFVAAKPGEHQRSCQDVAWFEPSVGAGHASAFAVADGATGGWDGQRWAELSVEAVADAITAADGRLDDRWVRSTFADRLDAARSTWVDENTGSLDDDPIQAMSRTKFLSAGGHCTLTAGVVEPLAGGRWRAAGYVIGDSPIVQLRPGPTGHRLMLSLPQTDSSQFDSSPRLLSSRPSGPGAIAQGLSSFELPDLQVGDALLVMTDALAEWALRRHEAGADPWEVLVGVDLARFETLIDRIRAAKEIVSDDVLLLRMIVAPQPFATAPASPCREEAIRR